MTSLIDVIFLLLLFFMLSSTFSRFSEVDLASAGSGNAVNAKPVFLTLGPDTLRLNGSDLRLDELAELLDSHRSDEVPLPVLISLREEVTSQRLTDLLVTLRAIPRLGVTVLEAS